MKLFPRLIVLVVAVALGFAALAEDPQEARLTFTSDPGDFIGLGESVDITSHSPGELIISWVYSSLPSGAPDRLFFWSIPNTPYYTAYTLTFSTRWLGVPIQTGSYPDAFRDAAGIAGHPGLDLGFAGRGCNQLSGNFTINQCDFFNPSPGVWKVAAFDATFEQHCEFANPALRGRFTYRNLAAPPPVPEPGTLALALVGGTGIIVRRLRKVRS